MELRVSVWSRVWVQGLGSRAGGLESAWFRTSVRTGVQALQFDVLGFGIKI